MTQYFRWAAVFLAITVLFFAISTFGNRRPIPPPAVQPILLKIQETASTSATSSYPTVEDFWNGRATFQLEVAVTGLPMGESETIIMQNGEWWSYLHASQRSANAVDQCGDPVEFPGCTVIYRSQDNGQSFSHAEPPVCQFQCSQCPCDRENDHTQQQQYPRVAFDGDQLWMVYEYLGRTMMRRSADGRNWSAAERVAYSGLWSSLESCQPEENIGPHPYNIMNLEQCLAGGPPGIFIENESVYVFVGMGQSPGSIGCFVGSLDQSAGTFQRCKNNPLFTSVPAYGPVDVVGAGANLYWDFRMLSSADVHKVGDRYYMLYEGLRGAGPGDAGDTQFGLGLARSVGPNIDGPWETYAGNPILVNSPANIGIGHADLIVAGGQTYLYTSLDGETRSRLKLEWVSAGTVQPDQSN